MNLLTSGGSCHSFGISCSGCLDGACGVLKVRNVLAQKAAWGLVLAGALAMPLVLPMASHWSVLPANVRVVLPADPETLLEELQARIQAKTPPEQKPAARQPGRAKVH